MSSSASSSLLRRALLRFYDRHRRDLPWRRRRDAYGIWVSEIMLQQTQVETVRPRFAPFLAEFPDARRLAAATEARVCEAWAGLGYYRRARNLHRAARQIVAEHGGELPRSAAELRRLPGIGRYTAGAIASIAYGEAEPLVDGNVTRVFARLHGRADARTVRGQRAVWAWAQALVGGDRPGDLNQALMELGALVCTPRGPQCTGCPVRRFCLAAAQGEPERFPKPTPARPRPRLSVAFLWLQRGRGVWLVQRPVEGLWAGLWELPSASGPRARLALAGELGVQLGRPAAVVRHELTHRQVRASIYVPVGPLGSVSRAGRWFADPLTAPLSALARKAITVMLAASGRSASARRVDEKRLTLSAGRRRTRVEQGERPARGRGPLRTGR